MKHMKHLSILGTVMIGLVLFAGHSFAEERGCNASGYHQYAVECLSKKLEESDAALNKAYKAVIERIKWQDERGAKALEASFAKAQKAWLEYVESHCDLYGKSLTSSAWAGVHSGECRIKHNKSRALELNSMYAGLSLHRINSAFLEKQLAKLLDI